MSFYLARRKLLDENDLPPQWNLLTGTADFSGDDWNWSNSKIETNLKAPNGNSVATEQNWSQVYKIINLTKGNYYTFSIDVKDVYAQILVQNPDGTDADCIDKRITQLHFENSDWHKAQLTFKCIKSSQVRIFEAHDNPHQVANMKLELGTIATPWMPAISDLALKSHLGG